MTRIGSSALLLRGFVVVVGFLALSLAVPNRVQGAIAYGVVAVIAVFPGVRPESWVVVGVELLAAVGWLVRTTSFGDQVSWIALFALASALYLHHVGSALAARLPLDMMADRTVWLRPASRALVVLAATGVLAAVAVGLSGRVERVGTVVVPVVGVLLSMLVVWIIHSRRSE